MSVSQIEEYSASFADARASSGHVLSAWLICLLLTLVLLGGSFIGA